MEPGIKEFFRRLSASIGLCVIWIAINTTIGIKYGYAFFEGAVQWSNIAFYIWLLVSFVGLVFLFKKIWAKPIEHLHDN